MALLGCAFASLSLQTGSPWHFYGSWILLGGAGTALSPVGYSRAVSTWFQRRRGLALGIVISGAAVAAVTQPPAAQALINEVGWRSAYLVIGAVTLVIGVPIAALFIRERPPDGRTGRSVATGATLAEGLRSRVFWTLVVVFFASAISLNSAIVHLAALLTDRGVSARSERRWPSP
jgi:MFS family permease